MAETLKVTLAQINPVVGDIAGNCMKIRKTAAAHPDSDLVVFSELVVSGYPPEDLVLKPFFLNRVRAAVEDLAKTTQTGPALLIGAPWAEDGNCYNTALLLADGAIRDFRHKVHLPNYGVFDEIRVFKPGGRPFPIEFRNMTLGVMICEDMWYPDIASHLTGLGANILISLNGSPYETDKLNRRFGHAKMRVQETKRPLIYVNQVGGQDELVFDGSSFVLGDSGNLLAALPPFEESVITTTWEKQDRWICMDSVQQPHKLDDLGTVYRALCLGLKDYVDKNGFPGVLMGLSGGIDSALSAAIAADALGPERVRCIMMPSPYTSPESVEDAGQCAALLKIKYETISIEPAVWAFAEMMDHLSDVAHENIQSRARGITLMALSNTSGEMVLSTGNKSEMSVGYATLYGDMCGGFNVLKDVYKTAVYDLARWRNEQGRVIPERILTKAPTAELKANQTDQDTLPPYDVLDDILQCLIEHEMDLDAIVARGHTPELVSAVWGMLDRAEYKRRQAPPGVKITSKAFGRDRRYPITNKFVDLLNK